MNYKEPNCKVWTPPFVVDLMLDLLPAGRILEPSAGTGAFMSKLDSLAVGVEIEAGLTSDSRVLNMDFFLYPTTEKFDGVIMNPPYLRSKHIQPSTRLYLPQQLSGHANLAYHFVWKCMDHVKDSGAIVAIVPEEMFRATGAVELNNRMYAEGTITNLIKFKKSPFLPQISQEVVVFKWVKAVLHHTTEVSYV